MQQRKKIVHLISSLKVGGAESLLYDLIMGLGSDNYEHQVICFHKGRNAERLQAAGIPVYHIQGLIGMYDPIFFWRLWRSISRLRPDVIHTSLWAANFAGRIIGYWMGIPTVSVIHLGVDLDGKLRNNLDRFTFNLATKIVAVSDGVAQSMHQQFSSLSSQKIKVIKNGINKEVVAKRAFEQKVSRQSIGLEEGHFVFGAVGRFIERKKFDILIESFALVYQHHSSARLVLVGLGAQESLLRKKAAQHGLDKEVIFVVGQSAYGYYPLFDSFVLPSSQEGLSIALLEALCCNLPCIVTSTNHEHEVIKNGYNGWVVEPDNLQELSKALTQLLLDKEATISMGNNAAKTINDHFSFNNMLDAYKREFEIPKR